MTERARRWLVAIAVALAGAGGLIFDALTPEAVTVGAFYVGMVLPGFWFPQRKAALGLALLATPLVILGYWIAIPDGTPPAWVGWANRFLTVGTVWLTAIFVWYIRVLEQRLKQQIDVAKSLSREIVWLASIVEFSNDAIISTNLDRTVTSWNKGAERLFGYLAEEAIGKPVNMLIPHERGHEEDFIDRRILRGERVDHYETTGLRKDGNLVDISLTISPVRDAEGTIVGSSGIARDITERKRSEAQISMLAREAEHRSRNLLANVKAMVRLSQSETPDGLKKLIEGRISALAEVHALFVQSRWRGVELDRLVKQELSPYSRDEEQRTRVHGPIVMLTPDVAQTVAMALHELATNAAKYGALSVAKGEVCVEWFRTADGRLLLRWIEAGGPPVSPPLHKGFGTHAMEALMRGHLGGDVRLDWRAEGLVCEMTVPA